jgi:hypothetical protein
MRGFSLVSVPLLATLALTACSSRMPPTGRWEGAYEDAGLIIVARLEIDSAGIVRVSAPNAIIPNGDVSKDQREELREKLEDGLAASWTSVAPLPLEFDGHAFHKPGGVAPQLEWSAGSKRMTLIYYSGNRASVRIPLQAVAQFEAAS